MSQARFLVMGMICSPRLRLLPVLSSLPAALQPLSNQCFPAQGPALPLSSLLSCFKAAAGFESWSFFSFLDTLVLSFHAQAPIPIASLPCSWQPMAVQSLIYKGQHWGDSTALCKHQWKRDGSIYLSVGSSLAPTAAPAQQSDAC